MYSMVDEGSGKIRTLDKVSYVYVMWSQVKMTEGNSACMHVHGYMYVCTLQMVSEWHCTRLFLGVFSPEVQRVDCTFNTGSLGLTLHPYVRTMPRTVGQLSAKSCYVHMQCCLGLVVE